MPPPGAGQELSAGGSGFLDITEGLGNIFGGSSSTTIGGTGSGTTAKVGTQRGTISEQLEIDEAGVQRIIQDILGSEQGLASIFSEENIAGIYSSSVASQASGNLLANLAGEIAKLTAKKVSTRDLVEEEAGTTTSEEVQTQAQEEGGLLDTKLNPLNWF